MYKRILLPLDGSALAEQVLPRAVAYAEHFQAELVLLRVLKPLPEYGISASAREYAEKLTRNLASEYLERVAARLRKHGLSVQVVTTEGESYVEIVQFAEANQVDLIVISTRGQSGLSRWLMGSVADRVVRGATAPVLLVRTLKAKME